jgi:hypothetical protein
MDALRKIFPQLEKIKQADLSTSNIFSFYDNQQRPIIILYAMEKNDVDGLVKKMSELKNFNEKNILQ